MQFQVMDIQACNDKFFQYISIRSGVEIWVGIVMRASLRMQKYMHAYRVTCVYVHVNRYRKCACVCAMIKKFAMI